ncbi:MAG TPA: alpha-1,4-glucan--maltose-1-phosphate maltosyltransferase [Phycisphaerales bacterium]|nr:alpha-1,4-glucan--maltose-1-phosphate maltosyltransferase [Phycisphaerales bacterium]
MSKKGPISNRGSIAVAPTHNGTPRPPAPVAADGRVRVVIEAVSPSVAGGFAVKRAVGESVRVEADVFTDGHDAVGAIVRHRRGDAATWSEVRMTPLVNDRWTASFDVLAEGWHEFAVSAWVDHFATWRRDLRRRAEAKQNLDAEFLIGAALIEHAAPANAPSSEPLRDFAKRLRTPAPDADRLVIAQDEQLAEFMRLSGPRDFSATSGTPVRVWVDRVRARYSSWYELFPRSTGPDARTHGTFRDVIGRLDSIAAMGFDVLYLPPIHPIGRQFRKGKNNTLTTVEGDVGSPWAIGGPEGGHDAIHPSLGSVEDFGALVRESNTRGIEVALDLALQCSPDHPYVKRHPEWFKHRPDGSIQYAENPPKKYQDIYPFDFECEDWRGLWNEILRVVLLWMERGVRIFRVDNPHTKPFALWEWLIAEAHKRDPGVLFLAEAFTRPKVMHRLAKLGFTQSYTYFAWRNGPWDLREYFTELTATNAAEYFRPNAWPNTPDILTEYLQHGGRGAFVVRAALAATLCASWGVYGPPFEHMEHEPAKPGSEEYLDSEKYQIRAWDHDRPDSLSPLLGALNLARRNNPALQQDRTLRFHRCDNPAVVCYSKTSGDNAIVVAANTDPHATQWSPVHLDLGALGLTENHPYQMHDLLTDQRFRWQGSTNVVGLDPAACPVHVFKVRRHQRTEEQFEYFL